MIKSAIFNFTDLYNGHKIENPTGVQGAKYYTLTLEDGSVYLQPHRPFVQGYEAITDENAQSIIDEHILHIEAQKQVAKEPIEKPE